MKYIYLLFFILISISLFIQIIPNVKAESNLLATTSFTNASGDMGSTALNYFIVGYPLTFISYPFSYNDYSALGSANLILFEDSAIQLQLNNKYVTITQISVNTLNTSCHCYLTSTAGDLRFTSNINGSFTINSNVDELKYKINENSAVLLHDGDTFNFIIGDNVIIFFSSGSTLINAVVGIIGIALFCLTPILAYIFSGNGRNKFTFAFVFIPLALISIGLILSFIYSGL